MKDVPDLNLVHRFLYMKTTFKILILVFLFGGALAGTIRAEAPEVDSTDIVTRVIDANTLLLKSGVQVRLIGVRGPSPYDKGWNEKLAKDQGFEKSSLGAYAEQAKEFSKYLVEGKSVRIELDPDQAPFDHKDREGRLFAYVWFTAPVFSSPPEWLVIDPEVSGTQFRHDALLNAALVRSGLAAMETGWPFSYGGKFMSLQNEASTNGRGFWKEKLKPAAEQKAGKKT